MCVGGRGCAIKFQTLARLLKFQSLKSGNNQWQNCRQTKSERKASRKKKNKKRKSLSSNKDSRAWSQNGQWQSLCVREHKSM